MGVLHCVEEITDVAGALALMGRAIQAGEAWPLAELLHAMAAVNIAESVRHSEREQALVAETEQLRRAVETRDVIGQAKGMVMERFDVDAAAAFDLLKRLSQDTNTPLREVAWKVVAADHSPQSN